MKKYLFLISIVFFVHNLSAQTTITYNKVKYFFGDSINSSGIVKSITKIDSNYYLGIDAISDSLLFTSYIVKLDMYGNKLQQTPRFGSDSIAYYVATGNGMIIDLDSNIITIGSYVKKQWGGFVIKLNKNMDTIWSKKYLFPSSLINYACDTPRHTFEAITLTPDGDYMIMGNYFINCQYFVNNRRPYMIKLDKNGNLLWIKTYDNLLSAFDIALTSDSGFVFSAYRNGVYGLHICKTDSLGNIEWFSKANNYIHPQAFDIIVLNDTIISVSPYDYYYDGNINNIKFGVEVTKTNSRTGQIIWNKQYIPLETVRDPTIHQHLEVEVAPNGDIVIGGTGVAKNPDSTYGAYKGFLLKLNSNGDSLWSHFYDWGSFFMHNTQFNDFVITDDGGILAGGYWNPPYLHYMQGAWLVKTDSLGNAPGMFTVGIEDKNTLIIKKQKPLLYPNPATTNFNLRFEQSPKEDMQLSIYSTSGALVKQQQLTAFGNEYRVDIGELGVGVYFIKLMSDGEILFSSKFIKSK